MAPGIGGNGSSGRHTGTVPKTKSHNESSRDYNAPSRRDYQSHFNLPNNLSSYDWQPVNESVPHSRTRKESNTSASRFSESYDTGENIVSQDKIWFGPVQRQAYNSDDDEASQASWAAENGYKSNNLGVGGGGAMGGRARGGEAAPDKTQVANRLHQIRDYVGQTITLMNGLRDTGGQQDMAQHQKLASMLEGLRDSELKLQALYERLDRGEPAQSEGKSGVFSRHQVAEPSEERSNKQVAAVPKTSEAARRNELKKQVHISQLKLQELHDEQDRLRMLRQRAIEQLSEARAARIAQAAEFNEEIAETSEMQNKLDELHAKKQAMAQLLTEFSNLEPVNSTEVDGLEDSSERNEGSEAMVDLNSMRDYLDNIKSYLAQERGMEKSELHHPLDKTNSSTSQTLQVKSQQVHEAKSKLLHLQTMLQTVEELRAVGQPIPDSLLQLMGGVGGGTERDSSPTPPPERLGELPVEMNLLLATSDRVTNSCERERSNFAERSCRSLNSCERERVNQQLINPSKHTNQEGKLSTKIQLDSYLRNQDLNLPPPIQNSSFHEPSIATGTWGGSTQSTLDDPYMPEYSGDMNESASVKNSSASQVPHNNWRKPSVTGDDMPAGSGASRDSWTSPYVPREARRPRHAHHHPAEPPEVGPDLQWIMQGISELQSEFRQLMSGLLQNQFKEKQHNCSPPPPHPAAPWAPPPNMSAALGPYCQYIASASQWQQQQLLVHSLNQCCQLIWHQQRELAALKEALRLQPVAEGLADPLSGVFLSEEPPPAGASAPSPSTPHSNLSRHTALKPSLSAGPSLAPPTAVTSAHSLPNLAQSQPSPSTAPMAPPNNRNLLSLPPAPDPNPYFADPNFVNLYPPYGNNLNFEFPSPVNFFPRPPEPFLTWASSQTHPPTTLNNQVPPGNRANNYWDNFRSYSRQNLLSNSVKSNDGLAQRTPLERFFNTDSVAQQASSSARHNLAGNSAKSNDGLIQRSTLDRYFNSNPSTLTTSRGRKERLNARSRQAAGGEIQYDAEDSGVGEASGYQSLPPPMETKAHARQHQYSNSFQNYSNDHEVRSGRSINVIEPRPLPAAATQRHLNNECESAAAQTRLVNESEPRRFNNECEQNRRSHTTEHAYPQARIGSERKSMINKRNFMEAQIQARDAKLSQMNNCQTDLPVDQNNSDAARPPNLVNGEQTTRPRRQQPRNMNSNADCSGEGQCLRGVRRKDNKGNVRKECGPSDTSGCGGDSLEECVYSEVAALISANERRPQFLLQLFKDLRLLSACPDTSFQADSLSSIHALAVRSTLSEHQRQPQEERPRVKEEPSDSLVQMKQEPNAEGSANGPQPRNWPQKDIQPQLPSSCAKLDWEVRGILVELLPFVKCRLAEPCGPPLLESLRRLVLHLAPPSEATQDQLDAQLEDALHKFHGCRLGDVYEELLTVVADVLISELTFLRLVNTVHHQNQPVAEERGDPVDEAEGEEGAVGGILDLPQAPPSTLHPANQTRRTKSEALSEADLAEADQLRHSASAGEEEERGDTAEGFDLVEEDNACAMDGANFCVGSAMTESKTEACWAVEQDRELGLDQVPTRLNNPPTPTTSPEESFVTSSPKPNLPESGPM